MKQPTKHKRYHMFTPDGTKVIKKFPLDHEPDYPWQRGTGPHKPETRKFIVDNLMKHVKGKAKSPEQRAKMSAAQKGVPKSEEHKKNISLAHKRRRQAKRERIQEAYRIAEEIGRDFYAGRLDQRSQHINNA